MKDKFFLEHIQELSGDNNTDDSSKSAAQWVLKNLRIVVKRISRGGRFEKQADLSRDLLLESGIERETIDGFLKIQAHFSSDSEIITVEAALSEKATDEEKRKNRSENSIEIQNTKTTLLGPLDEIVAQVKERVRIEAELIERKRILLLKTKDLLTEVPSSYSVSLKSLAGEKIPMLYVKSKHSEVWPGATVAIKPLEEVKKEEGDGAELFKPRDSLVTITEISSGNIITLGGDFKDSVSLRHLVAELKFGYLNHYFTPSRESGAGAGSAAPVADVTQGTIPTDKGVKVADLASKEEEGEPSKNPSQPGIYEQLDEGRGKRQRL